MKSALSALLLNRMGDTFFVICLGCMISYFHAVDFQTIELLSPHVDTLLLNTLAIMLLLAATAKSAQLGLHG
jgi:NADH-ubiquinone oxidoreductase chain 5